MRTWYCEGEYQNDSTGPLGVGDWRGNICDMKFFMTCCIDERIPQADEESRRTRLVPT